MPPYKTVARIAWSNAIEAPSRGGGLWPGCRCCQALPSQVQVSLNWPLAASPPKRMTCRFTSSKAIAAPCRAAGFAVNPWRCDHAVPFQVQVSSSGTEPPTPPKRTTLWCSASNAIALAQRPSGMVVDDAVATGVALAVAEGAGDADDDGFVAAGEPHAEKTASQSQTSRFIGLSSVARPCPVRKSPQHECGASKAARPW